MATKKATQKIKKPSTPTKKAAAPKPTKRAPAKKAKVLSSSKKQPKLASPKKKATAARRAPSKTSLYDRLLVKGQTLHIVDPPVGFEINMPVGSGLGFELPAKLGSDDALLAFVKNKAAVDALAPRLKKAARSDDESLIWLAYPKGTGSVRSNIAGDLSRDTLRDHGWDSLEAIGFVAVATVAVDDDWTALRVRHQSRTSRRP